MCEVEISDSNIVEVVDADFHDIRVNYGDYEVGGADDEYEEVTCEAEDSQGLLMQGMDDGELGLFCSPTGIPTLTILLSVPCPKHSSLRRGGDPAGRVSERPASVRGGGGRDGRRVRRRQFAQRYLHRGSG